MASSVFVATNSLQESPQESLNHYVAFMNQSVDELLSRFRMLQTYQNEVKQYKKRSDYRLRLPSSGPLEEYYYQKALTVSGLTPTEKQRLTASTQSLWQLLHKIDQTGKALETYVRLNDYQRDNLKQSDALMREMQALFGQFRNEKEGFYKQVQRVYRRYQPYLPTNGYLYSEKEMEQVLTGQKQLLDTLTFYLDEDVKTQWPVELVQQSMLADEKVLAGLGKARTAVEYPASDMIGSFKSALQSLQDVKRRAVDDHTFAAQQSSRHGNEVYLSLINYYNGDLLATYQSFVGYSVPAKRLLNYPRFCPVFTLEPPVPAAQKSTQTEPFKDVRPAAFTIKPADAPAPVATFQALNDYVEFINESLRQMHLVQLTLRNYQWSAEHYRDPASGRRRANLTYSHEDFKVPKSEYQLLLSASQHIPQPYRASINGQAGVLIAMLNEMDGLSIELIRYTSEKQYLDDHLKRSDAILDRYLYLFDTFDQKKERLYTDVRRIYESYPGADPGSSWSVAGKALLKTLDENKEILFGIKAYLKNEATQLPAVDKVQVDARALIANEYQNLKGLQRYGRNNGLCPYTPYEDLAENSLRFADMAQKVKPAFVGATQQRHPYEEFYYFYNNQLVYQYNNFSELAKVGLLKAITQPDLFIFRQSTPSTAIKAERPEQPLTETTTPAVVNGTSETPTPLPDRKPAIPPTNGKSVQHDTVYVERTRTDTVYVDRANLRDVSPTLNGFATNNMVLLLDVSASMDSPFKLPLLKRSIKSLLKLLRPEDQISVVVYSGKAKVALRPTSGSNADEIAQVIDQLQSTGDTDGNEGIRLAYKVANKNYIRAGNNRIVLATDGEFPVSNEVLELIGENAQQDISLTVFTFGRNAQTAQSLKKLTQLGKGTFAHVTQETADLRLVLEAQARKLP
ncbi:vWA domain-containing protein [Spirosoma fluminis]